MWGLGQRLCRLADPYPFDHLTRAVFRTVRGAKYGPADSKAHATFGRREAEDSLMTSATWITMLVIMAFVWGGFSTVLVTAIRKESGKRSDR